jgi:diguanylate cyclase (GGDEF)-like protein
MEHRHSPRPSSNFSLNPKTFLKFCFAEADGQQMSVDKPGPEPGWKRSRTLERVRTMVGDFLRPRDVRLRQHLGVISNRYLIRANGLVLPAATTFVAVLWSQSHRGRLLIWAAVAIIFALVQIWLRRGSLGSWIHSYRWWSPSLMLGSGLIWGAPTLIAMPSSAEWQAMLAMLLVGMISANTIYGAASRRSFFAFQVPIVAMSAYGFVQYSTTFTSALALIVGLSGIVSVVLLQQSSELVLSIVRLDDRNKTLMGELAHRADHDVLTGAATRLVFQERVRSDLVESRRGGLETAVLFIDVDRFKNINDNHGHEFGDHLLVEVARRISTQLRPNDVLARFGGDEFTVLLSQLTTPDDALTIAERIQQTIAASFEFGGRRIKVTASIGVAHSDDGEESPESLLRKADAALYRSKHLGRDRVQTFDESLRNSLRNKAASEEEVRSAFRDRKLRMWFQPEVDLATGQITGAEALARWIHPDGVRLAGDFIPEMEQLGMFREMSMTQGRGIQLALGQFGPRTPEGFRLHTNISASYLSDRRWISAFVKSFEEVGLDPSRIAFEVTETAVIKDTAIAHAWLQEARDAGITIFLDDFGMGYSSLGIFTELPVDGLKVDMSFVRQLHTSASARAIVGATAHLAETLGLKIIAEGVETVQQVEALLELGVHHGQGFLYSPAVPHRDFASWLTDGPPWNHHAATGSSITKAS